MERGRFGLGLTRRERSERKEREMGWLHKKF
jgi:hypothetical protein